MAIDLEKRKKTVRIILEKRQILKPPMMRAGLALDITGSAQRLYTDGVMQEAADRVLALAGQFDDNGEMDMWTFTTGFDRLRAARAADYGSYVKRQILDNPSVTKWGNTAYAPVMNDMVDLYFRGETKEEGGFFGLFGKKKHIRAQNTHIPALAVLLTDGQNSPSDRPLTDAVFAAAQQYPMYWSLVGVGDPTEFGFLEEMAEKYPNVGFVNFSSLNITDEVLYEKVITQELCDWARKFA